MKLQLSSRSFCQLLAWAQCLSLVILPLLSPSTKGFAKPRTTASSHNLGTQEPQLQSTIGTLFVVNSTGDDDDAATGNGICETAPDNGICTLRAAIEETNALVGDDGIRINIPKSDSGCTPDQCTIKLIRILPDLTDSVFITGASPNKLTVRRDPLGNNGRIFNVTTTGTVSFFGMTISGGFEDDFGGGIQNANTGIVNINNCVISDNESLRAGGGIENIQGTVNVNNSTITSNDEGGGIGNLDGTLNITNSTISNNYRSGIRSFNGTVNVTNSTISNNSASVTGVAGGGGTSLESYSSLHVRNSTICNNRTIFSGYGGGVFADSYSSANLESTVIALNTTVSSGPDVFGSFTSDGYNLIGKTDGSTGFTKASDQTGTIAAPLDPKLDPNGLQDNGGTTQTIALLPSSPAIDKGMANGLPTDQRGAGFSRTFNDPAMPPAAGGDNTDIGAFELQPTRLTSAGATLVNESCPPADGMIDPGESVTLNLKLSNNGGSSTNNLVATLQASSNVLVPSGPQTYGAIPAGNTDGRNFSFTANGNCGDVITLTLQLQDGATNLGTINYTFTLGCHTACAGAPRISTSTVLSCSNGNTIATITISNSGTVTASYVVLTTAKLGGVSGTLLPQDVGDLAPGASVAVTVTFTGAPSEATTLQVGGTYMGGTFNSSRRVTAPSC